MKKNMTTVTFKGTPEQEAQLLEVIAKYKGVEGALMPVLQQAQEIYGYLPQEVQRIIALNMDVSMEEVYGVTTFYSQFALNPKGGVAIAVCLGTACYVKGSGEILEKITEVLGVPAGSTSPDGRYSLEATRCIGAGGLAPVLTVNGEVFGRLTAKDVPTILAKYTDSATLSPPKTRRKPQNQKNPGGSNMKSREIAAMENAEVLCCEELLDNEVHSACGSDMMSDVLAYVKDQGLLITGLVNPQVVRTAEMMDMRAILFVRGKKPTPEILALAKQCEMVIMASELRMFEACGLIYESGLKGGVLK